VIFKNILKIIISDISFNLDSLYKRIDKIAYQTIIVYYTELNKKISKFFEDIKVSIISTVNKGVSIIISDFYIHFKNVIVSFNIVKLIPQSITNIFSMGTKHIGKLINKTTRASFGMLKMIIKPLEIIIENILDLWSSMIADVYKYFDTKTISANPSVFKNISKGFNTGIRQLSSIIKRTGKNVNAKIILSSKKGITYIYKYIKTQTTNKLNIVKDIIKYMENAYVVYLAKVFKNIHKDNVKSTITFKFDKLHKAVLKLIDNTTEFTFTIKKNIEKYITSVISIVANKIADIHKYIKDTISINVEVIKNISKYIRSKLSMDSKIIKDVFFHIKSEIISTLIIFKRTHKNNLNKPIIFKTSIIKDVHKYIYENIMHTLNIIKHTFKHIDWESNLSTKIVKDIFKTVWNNGLKFFTTWFKTLFMKPNFDPRDEEGWMVQIDDTRWLHSDGDFVRVIYINSYGVYKTGPKTYLLYGGTIYKGLELYNKNEALIVYHDNREGTMRAARIIVRDSDDKVFIYEEHIFAKYDEYWGIRLTNIDSNRILLTYRNGYGISNTRGLVIELKDKKLIFGQEKHFISQFGTGLLRYDCTKLEDGRILLVWSNTGIGNTIVFYGRVLTFKDLNILKNTKNKLKVVNDIFQDPYIDIIHQTNITSKIIYHKENSDIAFDIEIDGYEIKEVDN
jgi:hypothetical protein